MSDEKTSINPGFPVNFPPFGNEISANNFFNHQQIVEMLKSVNPKLFIGDILHDSSPQQAYVELSKFFSYGRGDLNTIG